MVINLNAPQLAAKDIMAVTGLDEFFCKVVIKVGKGEAMTEQNYQLRLWDWIDNDAQSAENESVFISKVKKLQDSVEKNWILF